MPQTSATTRNVKVFRYDPASPAEGRFDEFVLDIPDETTTTILDVLLRVQREQDPSLAFRYACRVNMCGSCAMVVNGMERLACKTNVSQLPAGQEITIRPLNHFPVIKDLVVDLEPFFRKYEEVLPFYEPREALTEPARIRPDSRERRDIANATECIACGCCVSSCTMVHHHEGYAGPGALNRAFTLLADSRDGLFEERLSRAMESCYRCRTEFNCTEVCPKDISGTRAIKYIQLLAVKHCLDRPRPAVPAAGRQGPAEAPALEPALAGPPALLAGDGVGRRGFLRQMGIAALTGGAVVALGGVSTAAIVGPSLAPAPRRWVPVGSLENLPAGKVTTLVASYDEKNGPYTRRASVPVLVSRGGDELVCFKAACPHLGCTVRWDQVSERFRCACHGGVFDRDGKVLAGPPPRPLDRLAFRIDSGQLLVEVG